MNFENMTGPQLVAAWNEMVLTAVDLKIDGAKPVKKFSDAATGRERCKRLHALIQHAKPAKGESLLDAVLSGKVSTADALSQVADKLEKVDSAKCNIDHSAEGAIPKELCRVCTPAPKHTGTAKLVEQKPSTAWRSTLPASMSDEEAREVLAKREAEKKAKQSTRIAKMKEAAAKKEAAVIEQANKKRAEKGLEPIAIKSVAIEKEHTMSKKSKTNGTQKRISNDAVITKLVKDPEKRAGTKSLKIWEKYRTGMTVGAWKEATKSISGAMNYLHWDISHKLIKVS